MLRWIGLRAKEPSTSLHRKKGTPIAGTPANGERDEEEVAGPMYLPRVALKPTPTVQGEPTPSKKEDEEGVAWLSNLYVRCEDRFQGVNPLYAETLRKPSRQSTSSGYGDSNTDSSSEDTKVKTSSGSSGSTLSTIPEGGRVDFAIPRPIWPRWASRPEHDSLVDEAVLLFTSLHCGPPAPAASVRVEESLKEMLVDLLAHVTATIEGRGALSAEEMLRRVNERIGQTIDALKRATEEEMRLMCVNLRHSRKVDAVMRAFSHTSSSSSQDSPEDIYHLPSSSSSVFSDCMCAKDAAGVPQVSPGRSAMCARGQDGKGRAQVKQTLLQVDDEKPSVWQQYYGQQQHVLPTDSKIDVNYVPKPTDVPIFPGGRPEADFTLDVPRSEMLSKRMKEDKKWRCRCRLFTSFMGLVFFLLSVMAVSLMLTRGRRMFGSMA